MLILSKKMTENCSKYMFVNNLNNCISQKLTLMLLMWYMCAMYLG